jgi:hypothetical protein
LRQSISVNVVTPWREQARSYPLTSGDFVVLSANAAGVNAAQWTARTANQSLNSGNHPDFTAEMFHQVGLAWWGQKFAFNDVVSVTNNVSQYQLPSHALIGAPITVRYFLGVARTASYKSRVIDAKEDYVSVEHGAYDQVKRRQYAQSAGQVGSMLEGNVLEQAFLMEPGTAVSTVSVLRAASKAGMRTYTLSQANIGSALANLQISATEKQEIQNAIAAGMRVTVPQQELTVGGFTGVGYIIEDPESGGAAYLISGGRNGGDSPAGEQAFPLPQVPGTALLGIMLGSSLRSAGASLVTQGGVIIGIARTAVAGVGVAVGGAALSSLLGPILVALMLLATLIVILNAVYPQRAQPLRLRKFSDSLRSVTNFASGLIRSSETDEFFTPTFGNGVYLTAQSDPAVGSINCPPTPAQSLLVATKYEIPQRGLPPEPAKASGYVDFEITRDNWYVVTQHPNLNTGVTEYVLRFPLIPGVFFEDNKARLYLGTFAPFIANRELCAQ